MMSDNSENIIHAIQQGGVIGAGGGGFPTYAKWKTRVHTVIANGSECEPLLVSDRTMMCEQPDLLIDGVRLAMRATGATQGVIALKSHYTDAISRLKQALISQKDSSITLHLLDNYYPAGDEFLLVYEVTGRVIPEGGLPLQVGVVVNNVVTLIQAAQAMHGKPVVERTVTLAGEFNEPKVIIAPIGTSYKNLVEMAGGLKDPDSVLIDGGPMMGKLIEDWGLGMSKTTSGILALPREHFVIRMLKKPLGQVMKQSKSACCQCFRCTDLCPRNLIGHDIYPHMTMRTIDYPFDHSTALVTSAFLCSQCGVCELLACDFMMLSPRKIYAAYRKALSERGIKNPHQKKPEEVRSSWGDRKISIETVLKKTDLVKYDYAIPFEKKRAIVKHVKILLNRHIGAPARPLVQRGQKVRMCDIIAQSPKEQLGTVYHASIEGKVTDCNDQWVEIKQ